MEISSNETYKHKDRMFKIKAITEDGGFHVCSIDEVTKTAIDHGACSHEVYTKIRNQRFSRDVVEGLTEVLKHVIADFVDRGVI